MDFIDQCMRQAALYPRWLVTTCSVIALVFILWILAKLLKWTVVILFTFTLVVILGAVLIWWLG